VHCSLSRPGNGDGIAEVLTGAGPQGGPHIEAFNIAGGSPARLASFYAYAAPFCDFGILLPPTEECAGVFVGGADIDGDGRVEIVTGTNRGAGPMKVFRVDGGVTEVLSFFPYFDLFLGPVHVASARPDYRLFDLSPPARDRIPSLRQLFIARGQTEPPLVAALAPAGP